MIISKILLKQVISRLNSINHRFRQASSTESAETKAENLKDIKTTYTMESERIVHDKVVSGQNGSDTPVSQNTEDDIEFF